MVINSNNLQHLVVRSLYSCMNCFVPLEPIWALATLFLAAMLVLMLCGTWMNRSFEFTIDRSTGKIAAVVAARIVAISITWILIHAIGLATFGVSKEVRSFTTGISTVVSFSLCIYVTSKMLSLPIKSAIILFTAESAIGVGLTSIFVVFVLGLVPGMLGNFEGIGSISWRLCFYLPLFTVFPLLLETVLLRVSSFVMNAREAPVRQHSAWKILVFVVLRWVLHLAIGTGLMMLVSSGLGYRLSPSMTLILGIVAVVISIFEAASFFGQVFAIRFRNAFLLTTGVEAIVVMSMIPFLQFLHAYVKNRPWHHM